MGLKGAPSYFQSELASKVLVGLLYNICELYIDDVVVHGDTEDSFVANLETLFERFSTFGVLLHPKKCSFGMGETEFVGHVIDGEGKRMSHDKIKRVLESSRPTTVKELRSFLGLVNYFREHLQNYATRAYPLYQLLHAECGSSSLQSKKGNHSRQRLVWTPAAIAA
jgi:cleavage and polyadenylation specificity factor subunit 1